MEAYKNCHDSNGIYGIINRTNTNCTDGMLYEHERKYESALRINSISRSPSGIAQILNKMGCHNLLYSYLDNVYSASMTNNNDNKNNNGNLSEMYYESCWRVCEWDMLSNHNKNNHGNHKINISNNYRKIDFHASIFNCLIALKSQNSDSLHDALLAGKLNLIKKPFIKKESIQPIYDIMVKWAMFNSIETAWNLLNENDDTDEKKGEQYINPLFDLNKTYKGREFFEILHPQNILLTDPNADDNDMKSNTMKFDDILFCGYDFDLIEPLLSLQSSLLSILPKLKRNNMNKNDNHNHNGQQKIYSPALINHLYFFTQIARKANRLSVAHRILKYAQQEILRNNKKKDLKKNIVVNLRENESLLMEYCIKLEEARYLKSEGNISRAIEIGEFVCMQMPRSDYLANQKSYENQQLRVECDCDIGEWMMLSHLRSIENVKGHLMKAEGLTTNLYVTGTKKMAAYSKMFNNSFCRASYLLAKFNDLIYMNLETKMKSQDWHSYINRLNNRQKQIKSLTLSIEQASKEMSEMQNLKKKSRNRRSFSKADNDKMEMAKRKFTDCSVFKKRLEKEYNYDNMKKQQVLQQRQTALTSAVENYCNSLILYSKYDLFVIYRLISLWFDNCYNLPITKTISKYFLSANDNAVIGDIMKDKQIPISKLIPLVHQIASRLSITNDDQFNEKSDQENEKLYKSNITSDNQNDKEKAKQIALNYFHHTIYRLIHKLSIKYPFHCLYQIFQISNMDKININAARIKTGFQLNKQKKDAALKLIKQLKINEDLQQIVIGIESLIDGYCDISNASQMEKRRRKHGQKVEFPIKNYPKMTYIMNLNSLPITTLTLPVDAQENMIKISKFNDNAQLAPSGITSPVIIDVLGNDGNEYRELVKPQDDLRQDAVMQQVFGLVNKVLLLNHNSMNDNNSINKYLIRSYNVIPLTPTVGIVEWVKGTIPIGNYLNKTHEKYRRPQDYLPAIARKKMSEAAKLAQKQQQKKKGGGHHLQTLKKAYDDICIRFPPIFHKFFLNKYYIYTSNDWFNARLSFIISCALNSIVGYLLGLGDRHTQNILIDLKTSELIHIDLGVAFDQGKLLKTPELVPFRLTRDIVDGFGLNSYNGTFKNISIKVLKLLRENQHIFYTVLNVFIHDPLYKWSLDPDKMNRLQHDDDDDNKDNNNNANDNILNMDNDGNSSNEQAERALHILKQKFQGTDNDPNVISVEGQVNRLIQEAIDPNNLCQMFHGWCSWM